MKHISTVIGLSGVARVGKDSFALHLSELIKNKFNTKCQIVSFAHCLKSNINDFIEENVGVSAFTQDTKEKAFIRPLLVAYGMTMRTLNPNYWILKIEPILKTNERLGVVSIVTDVRFPNEVDYLHNFKNSSVIHLKRKENDGTLLSPANEEEAYNDPLCRDKCNYDLTWDTFDQQDSRYKEYIQDHFLSLL